MPNKHIDEFLDYYIGLPSPQYAVLLKGKWGSGKTHYINEYKKHLSKINQKYIYVSLYGVTSYDEIETKFLETIHPKLYNKKTIFAGKIAKQLLKGTLRIDLDDDDKPDGNVAFKIPDFKPEDLLNTKDYILIFDDLERCSIKIIDLLGYLNFFVEHQSYKVIVIANEEELEKTEKYTSIKEKLIGKTFEFKSNPILAYDNFLLELKNTNNIKEGILSDRKMQILELFEKSQSNNLRALRQSLLDFERFYDDVLLNHLENKELIQDVLYWFFLFSFEIRQGNSDILDLPKLSEEYHELLSTKDNKEKAEKTNYKLYLNRYNLQSDMNVIIFFNVWKEILIDSNIKKDEIDNSLKNSKYYASKNINSWKLLHSYYNLDDEELIKLSNEIYFKLHDNQYKKFEEVKIVSSILLSLKEKNLINKIEFSLIYEIKKQIDFLFDNNLISDEVILDKDPYSFDHEDYEGYMYMESKLFTSVVSEYIKDKTAKKLEEKLKVDSSLIIAAISENNINRLYSMLFQSNNKYVPYYDKPIFKYIDMDILVESLKNSNNETIRRFSHILKERYNFEIENLIEEEEFLMKLKERIELLKDERDGKLSGYYFVNFCITLEKIIKKFDKHK
ncbi:MAG: P-loop NTPase fold protein [Arcobacter sp.]|uniref:P-loop NTPase fold protein n=1 Tax=Arcobacter sp. TaxID=1872629 RepID=UPI003B0042A5